MSFEPYPEMRINMNGKILEFASLEARGPASAFVYAEDGKEGIVYKVLIDQKPFALKVLYPDYKNKRLIKNTKILNTFSEIEGLKASDRLLITTATHPDVIDKYPEINYSIIMPWIDGYHWGNLMIDDHRLHQQEYIQIAKSLLRVICNLETQGIAHCDLSNDNFIIQRDFSSVELIDIEDIYAPKMPRPIPDISYGSVGYRAGWVFENGLWGPESDRFACAILCAEILTWHNVEIRKSKGGDNSFFSEDEIGEDSERYHLIMYCLNKLNPELPKLFKKAWLSQNLDQCPSTCDWMKAVNNLEAPKIINNIPDVAHDKNVSQSLSIKDSSVRSSPPKMDISHSIMDFGVLSQSNNSRQIIISNTGDSMLIGNFILPPWLDTSITRFNIQPGDKRKISVTIKEGGAKPRSGFEYRFPNALIIESNAGTEVVEVIYKLFKQGMNQRSFHDKYKLSLSCPKIFSKRYESIFLLHLYLPDYRIQVEDNIRLVKSSHPDQNLQESIDQGSPIMLGQTVKIKISSPVLLFKESEVCKVLSDSVNDIVFLGTPNSNCEPGNHKVLISILDAQTENQLHSLIVGIYIADFAFGVISRPLLSKISAIVLGIGSFAMFTLMLMEQIDKAIGLTSGTAAGVLALGVYMNFYNLYQRIRPNTP